MSLKVAVYYSMANRRSRLIADAMAAGVRGDIRDVTVEPAIRYRAPDRDVAIFYGLADGLRRALADYQAVGRRAIYIDLGYWGRRKRTRFDGYHKLALNSRHPTEYFQTRPHPAGRFLVHGVTIAPWRHQGRHIVVAGMSAKGAMADGFMPHQWERDTIERLRQLTDRPIIYRPKPNWPDARPITGSSMDAKTPIEQLLRGAHAVVTHHSNVAVDAILAGVPAICPVGVASAISSHALEDIERLPMHHARAQWAADVAFTQWSLAEMQSGAAWRYLRDEGLAG